MGAVRHLFSLAHASLVLARTGAGLPLSFRQALPFWIRIILPTRYRHHKKNPTPLAQAFSTLGPTYIKLGQFLAVRTDILDERYVKDLSQLHNQLPPFPQEEAEAELTRRFGGVPFVKFGEAVAAASIAQVHQAKDADGKIYAVKILRPQIEKRFARDMESFFWLARKVENHLPAARRLQPVAALENLQAITLREMDLRLEAAAMAEMAENLATFDMVYIPRPDWQRTRQTILTTEWVDGIAINNITALKKAGHDLSLLAKNLLQIFLRCALHDGFFHADFHPGNLFVRSDGVIVPVDFGIMGRLAEDDRRAMAWILHGLISGDYRLAARHHIEVGYVPADTDEVLFAQALRAIAAPILDRPAIEISMADLLLQLFKTAGRFEMRTQPQLLLLQKTMVATEGLARQLDPALNIWQIAAPVVEAWIAAEYRPTQLAAQATRILRRLWLEATQTPPPPPREPVEARRPPSRHQSRFWLGILIGALFSLGVVFLFTPAFLGFFTRWLDF